MSVRDAARDLRKKWRKKRFGPLAAATREGTFRFWDRKCVYCGMPAVTLDHFIPKSRGGRTDITNMVPACRPCQHAKDSRQPADFCRDRGLDFMLIRSRMKQRASLSLASHSEPAEGRPSPESSTNSPRASAIPDSKG